MSYKRIIISLLILSLIITLSGCTGLGLTPSLPNSTTLQNGVFYLEPANCNPTPGKDFEMELKVSSIEDLKGYSVVLSYDPAVLKLVEIAEGPCLSEGNETFFWKKIDLAKGTIQIDCAILGTEISAYGEGSLATLYFTVLTKANTEVGFSLSQTRDTRNHPILTNQKSVQVKCR